VSGVEEELFPVPGAAAARAPRRGSGPPTGAGTSRADEAERLARVALNAISEPADPRLARLVAALGATEVHERLAADLDLAGTRSEAAERLAAVDPVRVLEEAASRGIRFVVPGDPEWPPGMDDLAAVEPLNRLTGAPLGLWVRGALRLDGAAGAVAVVGSRSATTYGTSVAGELAAHVAGAGTTVVSGAAFGIDQAAHRGALAARGPTVAVLACGVDRAYPAAHRGLLDYVAEVGAVVSELRPGCAPTRVRFLSRNRLIAAMSGGTVVVEAAVRSGALNTANWATRLNRVLMGVPGPVTSAPSEGVHELVRTGAAALVTRGEHVLELLAPVGHRLATTPRAEVTARDRLDPADARVLEAVPLVAPAPLTSIARTAALATSTVLASLGRLQAAGWVEGAGGRWRRAPVPPE
jgi:DNA processing protein